MKRTITLIALLLTLNIFTAGARQYFFKKIGIENGLPNNTVFCCAQDHRGFIWVGTRDGLFRYDGSEFRSISNETSNGKTYSICEDSHGRIWFATSRAVGSYDPDTDLVVTLQGIETDKSISLATSDGKALWMVTDHRLIKYNTESGEAVTFSEGIRSTSSAVTADKAGDIWSAGPDNTILHIWSSTGEVEVIRIDKEGQERGAQASRIICTDTGMIVFTTDDGRLMHVRPTSKIASELASLPDGVTANCITEFMQEAFCIGTPDGIYTYSPAGGIEGPDGLIGPHGLSNNYINCIMQDNEGSLWVGTFHGGLNQWFSLNHGIRALFDSEFNQSIKGNIVNPICLDSSGNIWIGTEDGGLSRINNNAGIVEDLGALNNLPRCNYHSMALDGDIMWVCDHNSGVMKFDERSGRLIKKGYLSNERCYSLLRSRDGSLYCGTGKGLYVYETGRDRFVRVSENAIESAHAIFEDSKGGLWIGTQGLGMYHRQADGKVVNITTESNRSLRSNFVTSFYEDMAHRIWITTEEAGAAYSELSDSPVFTHVDKAAGMPSDIACAVAQSRDGSIWISTNNGLVQYSSQNHRIVNIFRNNTGLISDAFSPTSCCQLPDGRLAFGTYSGLMLLNPSNLNDPIKKAHLYITEIGLGSGIDRRTINAKGKSAITSDAIRLRKKDAGVITIKYSALCYANLSDIRYEYVFGKKFHAVTGTTSEPEMTFTNLAPGRYTFTIRVLESNSSEASKTLAIRILPPFYQSAAANIFYLILIGIFIYGAYAAKSRREKSLAALDRERLENQKQQELNDAKIGFFTNITHEFRTPLSLIKMPLEKIIANKQYAPECKEDIMTIKANTDRLIELSNQFLDIKKAEKRKININYREEDICSLVKKVSEYFTHAVKERHIEYNVAIPSDQRVISCDRDLVEKVLTNLLSNAVKYCKDKITLDLSFNDSADRAIIRVDSNGDLISSEDRVKIFLPFYQIKTVNSQLKGSSSTGLGLPYALELASAMGGKLRIDETRTDMNSFVFDLPTRTAVAEPEVSPAIEADQDGPEFDNSRHTILVVEDSNDMREYLAKELAADYNVLSAGNGEEGLEVIHNQKVDLVVSDIMMPVMDGCQLCNTIKKDIDYSHIPVILLTAAVGVETRIETLEVGADGYIEKPFSIELLRANIASLFKNREIAYNQFANAPLSHFSSSVTNNVNQEFMDELHAAVMDNIADQNLSIETLTSLMHTSKSTLYRKVKANTGLNINEYIRICRLKMAAELLSKQTYRINEVAYLTGFSSPSYFTTSFQKQFNISPSNFVKNLNKKD